MLRKQKKTYSVKFRMKGMVKKTIEKIDKIKVLKKLRKNFFCKLAFNLKLKSKV